MSGPWYGGGLTLGLWLGMSSGPSLEGTLHSTTLTLTLIGCHLSASVGAADAAALNRLFREG